jgi:hypothetical protein
MVFPALLGCGPTIPPPVEGRDEPSPERVEDASANTQAAAGVPPEVGPRSSKCDGKAGQNLARGGTATSSNPGDGSEEGPQAAFDDHTGTSFVQSKNPHPWLAYEFGGGAAQVVTQYALTPAPMGSSGSDPVSWKFEGSNDGVSFTTLHEQHHHRFVNRLATMWYAFENQTAYRRYRLIVTENGGGAGVQLAELQLFGAGTPTFSIDDSIRGRELFQFQYSPGWEGHGTGDCAFMPRKYGCSSSWSRNKNETVTFAFVGSEVHLFGIRFPNHGIAAVSIDGGAETTADFFGPNGGNTLFYSSPPLCPPGRHVLRLRVTGDKNASSGDTFISIDRAEVVP